MEFTELALTGGEVCAASNTSAAPQHSYVTKKKRALTGQQLEWFELFWSAFEYKAGKADAADAWIDLDVNAEMQKIILGAAKIEAKNRTIKKQTNPNYIPKMAQGWLSGRRFEDEVYTANTSSATMSVSGGRPPLKRFVFDDEEPGHETKREEVNQIISTDNRNQNEEANVSIIDHTVSAVSGAGDRQIDRQIGFNYRPFANVHFPIVDPGGNEYVRKVGPWTLTMLATSESGLPFGAIPRLIFADMCSHWIKTNGNTTYCLGRKQIDALRKVGIYDSTGGKTGTIQQYINQVRRVVNTFVVLTYSDDQNFLIKKTTLVDEASLPAWITGSKTEWRPNIQLNTDFFMRVSGNAYPIDMDTIFALRDRPQAMDIYVWAAQRSHSLKDDLLLTWEVLFNQFASHPEINDRNTLRNFRVCFWRNINAVKKHYPELNIEPLILYKKHSKTRSTHVGLIFKPSPTHVRMKKSSKSKK